MAIVQPSESTGIGEDGQIGEELHELPDGQLTRHHLVATEPQDQHGRGASRNAKDGHQRGRVADPAHGPLDHLLLGTGERRDLRPFLSIAP